jgi:hypothetical protein
MTAANHSPSFGSLPLPALERICAEVLDMVCPQSAGAFLGCCKAFYNAFVGIEHQLTMAVRAQEEQGSEVPPFIARLFFTLAESRSLTLTYNRLYVCIKAGSNFPSLAIYTDDHQTTPAAYSVATNMQLELIKENIIYYETKQKDVYAVSFSPITSAK